MSYTAEKMTTRLTKLDGQLTAAGFRTDSGEGWLVAFTYPGITIRFDYDNVGTNVYTESGTISPETWKALDIIRAWKFGPTSDRNETRTASNGEKET